MAASRQYHGKADMATVDCSDPKRPLVRSLGPGAVAPKPTFYASSPEIRKAVIQAGPCQSAEDWELPPLSHHEVANLT
jgi:hypothetical protein